MPARWLNRARLRPVPSSSLSPAVVGANGGGCWDRRSWLPRSVARSTPPKPTRTKQMAGSHEADDSPAPDYPLPDYPGLSMGPGSLLSDVFIAAQEVNQLLKLGLDGAPLTPNEYAVYSFILEHPDLTPTALSVGLGMPLQTLSDWLSRPSPTGSSPDGCFDGGPSLLQRDPQSGGQAGAAGHHAPVRSGQQRLLGSCLTCPRAGHSEALASLINASASARLVLRGEKTA